MTADEIRQSESGESKVGNEVAFWLREIALQLAEIDRDLVQIIHVNEERINV